MEGMTSAASGVATTTKSDRILPVITCRRTSEPRKKTPPPPLRMNDIVCTSKLGDVTHSID